jgi:cytochrome c peroxidase
MTTLRGISTAFFLGVLVSGSAVSADQVTLGDDTLTRGIPGSGALSVAEIQEWLSTPINHEIVQPQLPLGLKAGAAQIIGLRENPLTRAKVELGRQLYFETRLSSDNTVSCASCHHPDDGFARNTQFGIGVDGQEGGRNSPVSYNRILSGPQFWDGRAASLEAQAVGPIANPIEMGNTHDAAVATLKDIPGYVLQFDAVFGKDEVNIDNVGKAIAAFERVLVTGPSAYDYSEAFRRFANLDEDTLADLEEDNPAVFADYQEMKKATQSNPMSESALRGQKLFFSKEVNCSACHVGANLADEKYHNLGIGMDKPNPDLGRFAVSKDDKDRGAFKTPTIRNVVYTAPYMHDGSLNTLEEVVEHYNKGGTRNPWLSDKMRPLKLTDQDKKDLVNFMKACTGSFPRVERGRLPE